MLDRTSIIVFTALFFNIVLFTKSAQGEEDIKVLSFSQSDDGDNISYVTLANNMTEALPDQFVVCASHFLEKLSNRGIFQLYAADGKPWMNLYFHFWGKLDTSLIAWLAIDGKGPFQYYVILFW